MATSGDVVYGKGGAIVRGEEAIPYALPDPRSTRLVRSAFGWSVSVFLFVTSSLVYLLMMNHDNTNQGAGPTRNWSSDPSPAAVRFAATSPLTSPAHPTPLHPRATTGPTSSSSCGSHVRHRESEAHPHNSTVTDAATQNEPSILLHHTPPVAPDEPAHPPPATANSQSSHPPPHATHTNSLESSSPPTPNGAPSDANPQESPPPPSSKKKAMMKCSGVLSPDGSSVSYRCTDQ